MVTDINEKQIASLEESQIVLYQPDETITLEVRLEKETVWLSQLQLSELFQVKVPAVNKHINNIYEEGELDRESTISILEIVRMEGKRMVRRDVEYYNLDVIISVGYRIKSQIGTRFRRWANNVLKEYLLRGYSFNRQIIAMQERVDERFHQIEKQNLVKGARRRVIIVDAYVSALTLDILDSRSAGVEAVIYTSGVGAGMQRLMQEHDRLFPSSHIDIRRWRKESHDRWLIIDNCLYHCGHSLNANGGHKISAITKMGTPPDVILEEIQNA